jgi:hypothetical protein
MAEEEDRASLGRSLAAALGITDPKVAKDLADRGAQGRELYRAKAPASQWQPAVTDFQLPTSGGSAASHGRYRA